MSKKIIKLGSDARNELIKGADFIGDAVKSTLGPYGSNFFLQKGDKITNDGVTVAKEIWLENEVQNRGVRALQEAASRTNDEAGDGTTTAITLAQAILKEASRYLGNENKGVIGKKTPIQVLKQIEKEKKEVLEKLALMTKPITTKEELINSAKVSVEDEELGRMIGETQWELGKDSYILAEETADRKSSIEKVSGIRIDNGFGTAMLINNQEKQMLEVNETKIILTNYTLKDFQPLMNVMKQLNQSGVKTLTIIARGFTSECIRLCLQNIQNGVNIYPISAPYYNQNEVMKDLAAVLGAKYMHDESTVLEEMHIDDVGFAEKVVARRFDAILTGKNDIESKIRITNRVKELEDNLKSSVSDFDKKHLQQRISQLSSGFAILKVGANSETERGYKKDKADDAVNAVRLALQEGVVKGAGLTFKEIADSLPDDYILKRPLKSIYEQIKNSAPNDWTVPDWVNDPVAVLRIALNNACSVAGTLSTAGGVIVTKNPSDIHTLLTNKNIEE